MEDTMNKEDISSLLDHIEGHLQFAREALAAGNAAKVAEQAIEIAGWASSVREEAAAAAAAAAARKASK